jgi:hypothetical protein
MGNPNGLSWHVENYFSFHLWQATHEKKKTLPSLSLKASRHSLHVLFENLKFYELLGPLDNNGYECPVSCPMNCGKDMMNCPGGDDGYGCMMPDTCISTVGGEYQVDNFEI